MLFRSLRYFVSDSHTNHHGEREGTRFCISNLNWPCAREHSGGAEGAELDVGDDNRQRWPPFPRFVVGTCDGAEQDLAHLSAYDRQRDLPPDCLLDAA